MIVNICKEEPKHLSSDQFIGDLMEEELDVETYAFLFDVYLDSFARITNNLRFDLNELSVDLSTNQSLENISLNEVVPEQMDIEITSMLDTKIDTRDKI